MSTTLTAYRVPPQMEFKAAQELRKAGRRAYLPVERIGKRKAPVARGYVFSDPKPHDAKHVRGKVGEVQRVELIRLYPTRDRGHERTEPKPFAAGEHVEIKVGPFASMTGKLTKKRGRRQWLVDVGSKIGVVSVQTTSLIRLEPG